MPHPGMPPKVTLKFNPDEDLQFISVTRGTQTETDYLPELYSGLKKEFHDLSVFYGELDEKYEKAKEKFAEVKGRLEEQKAREARLPVMYRDQYVALLADYRKLEKNHDQLKERLHGLIDSAFLFQ